MPPDPTFWMWAEACELLDRAERLQRRFFRPRCGDRAGPVWEPPVDIVEGRDGFLILVALPGVPAEATRITVSDAELIVSAERPPPLDGDTLAIHGLEIPHGRFERRIPLPAGRLGIGEPGWRDGCLRIPLHKLP